MKNHRPLAWIAVSLLSVLSGAPSLALAAEEVSGIVKEVDVEGKKIVVTPTGKEQTVDVAVTEKTKMETESGDAIALKKLKPGDGVGIALKAGVALNVKVAVGPEKLVGHVKSVDPHLKLFVITQIGTGVDASVAINGETSIVAVDGKKLDLKDLKKGDGVGIAHSRSLASKIVVNAKPVEKDHS